MEPSVALSFAVALACGVIIGLERGWVRSNEPGGGPGIRTFALVALLGAICAWLDVLALTVTAFVSLVAVACTGYILSAREARQFGYTTEIALLITYFLGLLAVQGEPSLAIAAAVVTALILGLKPEIHGALKHVERLELLSTLQLLVAFAVILPLLPDRDLWLDGLNLHLIGWFVLLVLGISWLGYVCLRLFGERLGLLLAALFGGLTSSTAVTASFARRASRQPELLPHLARGILLACTIMPVRMLLIVTVVNQDLLMRIAPGLLALLVVPLMAAAVIRSPRRQHEGADSSLELGNPLDLASAAMFAGFLTVLFVAVPWLETAFGHSGVLVMAAVSGLTDVDAISLTLARHSLTSLPPETAALGMVIAAAVNTIVKAGIAIGFSSGQLSRTTSLPLLLGALLAGLVQAIAG
ncbi:MAG: MgtC/SapB family protein [Pseudomonadales bacterium]|nr:MgtC/SapB family protein [Pseudomonadales bacterium]MCP5182638.1 MgtC/SapB family protein [Pseudomonadales bacterium]